MHIFEEQIIWQFQKLFFENPRIRALPPDHHIFWKKPPREKSQKVDPHYFSILEGVFFTFSSSPLSASKLLKTAILPLKLQKGIKIDIFLKTAI